MPKNERKYKMAHVKPVNKKKMGRPALIATIISVVILLALVVSLVASTGIFVRVQAGASTENFNVNGSMLSYYTYSYYNNWMNQSYIYYVYLYGYNQIDTSKPLTEQYTTSSKTETYYDFFSKAVKTQVETYLKYCEAALENFTAEEYAKAEADAEKYADEYITAMKADAKKNNMDLTTYIRQTCGEHANKDDVRKAIIIEYIASEYYNVKYKAIYNDMTDDRKVEYFKANLGEFVKAEYLTFSLSHQHVAETVKPENFAGGKDSQEYKNAVAKAEQEAKEKNEAQKKEDEKLIQLLADAKDEESFKRIILGHKYETAFTTAYDAAVKNFADSDKPTADQLKAFKDSIRDAAIDAVIDGRDTLEEESDGETSTAASKTKWETLQETLPKSVITELKKVITTATKTQSYTLSTDLGKWLFPGVKAQFGVDYAEGEEKGENAPVGDSFVDRLEFSESEKAAAEAIGKYTITVNFVTKSAYRDETPTRNVGHILFQVDKDDSECFATSAEAKAEAEKILAQIKATADSNGLVTKEVFESFAKEHNMDSNNFYDDVCKGEMVEAFETWLFDAKTVGEIGLVESTYGWHIMYYGGESEVTWMEQAQEKAREADMKDWYDKLPYKVTINENIIKDVLN